MLKTKAIEKKHPIQFYRGGFMNGLGQVKICDELACRHEIWEVLKINNMVSFNYYKRGAYELKPSQIERIEAIFNSYGVFENIWGSI